MEMGLQGRTALVTGASRGIGKAIAAALAAEGCHLELAATNEGLLAELAADLARRYGVAVRIHPGDLTREEDRERLGLEARNVDILVNNAGAVPRGSIEEVDDAAWRQGWELKVFGYINLTRAIYPAMRARGSGVIVNVIGVAGVQPNANYIATTTANAAMIMFTASLGGDSVRHGVRVVGVNPGPTISDRFVGGQRRRAKRLLGEEERWPEFLEDLPMGRASTVEEVADTVVFLASDRARAISGTSILIDGGLMSRAPRLF